AFVQRFSEAQRKVRQRVAAGQRTRQHEAAKAVAQLKGFAALRPLPMAAALVAADGASCAAEAVAPAARGASPCPEPAVALCSATLGCGRDCRTPTGRPQTVVLKA
ncbi:hypothetical protein MNEG_11778, partial [Monoraphidium neglectum]